MHNDILSISLCISKFQIEILNQEIFIFFKDFGKIKYITFKYDLINWYIILKSKFQSYFIKGDYFNPNQLSREFCRVHEIMAPKFLKNPSQVSASDDMSQFLLKKQQLQAMLAAAKTPQEFQKILDEGSSSFSQENSYAESDDSTSYLPDNGDDCEGILPPIRRSK